MSTTIVDSLSYIDNISPDRSDIAVLSSSKSFFCALAPRIASTLCLTLRTLTFLREFSNNSVRYTKTFYPYGPGFTNEILTELLSQFFMSLDTLFVVKAPDITNDGLLPVLINHPTIVGINFERCPGITTALYVRLIAGHPREKFKQCLLELLAHMCHRRQSPEDFYENRVAAYDAGFVKTICDFISPTVNDVSLLDSAFHTMNAFVCDNPEVTIEDVALILPSIELGLMCSDTAVCDRALACLRSILFWEDEEEKTLAIVQLLQEKYSHLWDRIVDISHRKNVPMTTMWSVVEFLRGILPSLNSLKILGNKLDVSYRLVNQIIRKLMNPFDLLHKSPNKGFALIRNLFNLCSTGLIESNVSKFRQNPQVFNFLLRTLMGRIKMMVMNSANGGGENDITPAHAFDILVGHFSFTLRNLSSTAAADDDSQMFIVRWNKLKSVSDFPVIMLSEDKNNKKFENLSQDERNTLLEIDGAVTVEEVVALRTVHNDGEGANTPFLSLYDDLLAGENIFTDEYAVKTRTEKLLKENPALYDNDDEQRQELAEGVTLRILNLYKYGQSLPEFLVESNFVESCLFLGSQEVKERLISEDVYDLTFRAKVRILSQCFSDLLLVEDSDSPFFLQQQQQNGNHTTEIFIGTHYVNEFGDIVSRTGEDDDNYLNHIPEEDKKYILKDQQLLELLHRNYELENTNDQVGEDSCSSSVEKKRIKNLLFNYFKRKKSEFYVDCGTLTDENNNTTVEEQLVRKSKQPEQFLKFASGLYEKQPKKFSSNSNSSDRSRRRQRDETIKVVRIEGNKSGDVEFSFGRLGLLKRICRMFSVEEEGKLMAALENLKKYSLSEFSYGENNIPPFSTFIPQLKQIYKLAKNE